MADDAGTLDPAVERLADRALELLEAARAHGDPAVVAAAESAAFAVGQILARSLKRAVDDG